MCFDFWGKRNGPYIQALHFCLSLGLLTGPLLVDPISQTRVPEIVQKALPIKSTSTVAPLLPTFAGMNNEPHYVVKREAADHEPTIDPLLAELLVTQKLAESSTSGQSSIKTPKPKPIFTDARKLDNSRDWEKVKIEKPPQEELVEPTLLTTTTTTTTTTASTVEQDPVLLMLAGKDEIAGDL